MVRTMQGRGQAVAVDDRLPALALGGRDDARDHERIGREIEVILPFTGRRRPKVTRTCACGCGRQFSTTFPNQQYYNEAHKKRAYRAASRNVQG